MFSKGTQGIGLINNQFYSNSAFAAFGALINNSLGTGGADVEFNTFTDMNVANLFEQDNSALTTHCNTYQGAVGDVSWRVKGVLKNQGDPNNPLVLKPDNKFIWDCIPDVLLDIRNAYAQIFSYFERTESAMNTNTILKCTEGVSVIPDLTDLGAANCVIEDPCPDPPNCITLATKYNESGKELRYRNQLLRAYGGWDWSAAPDSNFLPALQKGVILLTGRNQQEDKRILAATHTALGNYSEAQTWLQQVGGTDAETQDFIQLYNMLISAGLAGRDVYHLTAQDFASVSGQLTHTTAISEQVRVLDHVINGNYHPLSAEEEGSGGRPEEHSETSTGQLLWVGLQVFPNPFGSKVYFIAPEGAAIKTLTMTDISGKLVLVRKAATSTETVVLLQTLSLPEGVLLYKCQLSNGQTLYGKIIHSSK